MFIPKTFYIQVLSCVVLLQFINTLFFDIGTVGTVHAFTFSTIATNQCGSRLVSCSNSIYLKPSRCLSTKKLYATGDSSSTKTTTSSSSNTSFQTQSTDAADIRNNINSNNNQENNNKNDNRPNFTSLTPQEEENLSQFVGGYTVKQRLREEVESPFRKVRLIFFASSAGSALTALYFSSLSALKAYMGGYSDAPPLDEALTSCAINIGGAIVCALLAYRDYQVGQANLERIARGGKLAKLAVVSPSVAVVPEGGNKAVRTLSEYRRKSRVLICAGGKEYVENICRSLNADQRSDENILPQLLADVDVLVVPVCLTESFSVVGDTKQVWRDTSAISDMDRNLDTKRSDEVVAFPWNTVSWTEYLQSEIDTARKQGFDVLSKGITILVKKNGKILRRATGAPKWDELIGTMEVMDGSRFGMPGDTEKYGGI